MNPGFIIGDWMGSIYGVGGQRCDWHLFLDRDGRYERMIRREPDYQRRDAGRWEYDKAAEVLRLVSETPDRLDRMSEGWWVLSVTTCEDSNVLLVLREAILASRNLPIVLYRVHCNGRGYGTDWEKSLPNQASFTHIAELVEISIMDDRTEPGERTSGKGA